MAMIFGADSTFPATTRLSNGYSLFQWVMRRDVPRFWGRGFLGEDAIAQDEIDHLHEKGCKIALIVNDLTEIDVSTQNGTADAQRAADAAKALGVPANAGIALFADIHDDWSVNHNWMISFAHTLVDNGYVPGFIGNTDSSLNFSFDRDCSHFIEATEDVDHYGAIYGATQPKKEGNVTEWEPFCPSVLTPGEISLWRCGAAGVGDVSANETYMRDESILDHMW